MRLFYLSVLALFLVGNGVTTPLYAEDDDTAGVEQSPEEGQPEETPAEEEPAEAEEDA